MLLPFRSPVADHARFNINGSCDHDQTGVPETRRDDHCPWRSACSEVDGHDPAVDVDCSRCHVSGDTHLAAVCSCNALHEIREYNSVRGRKKFAGKSTRYPFC
jgi:hypothetical protein